MSNHDIEYAFFYNKLLSFTITLNHLGIFAILLKVGFISLNYFVNYFFYFHEVNFYYKPNNCCTIIISLLSFFFLKRKQ